MYQDQILQQSMAATSNVRAVRPILKQKSRSLGSDKPRAKKRTTDASGNGFLSHSFAPLVNGYSKAINAGSKVANSILCAARNLCDLYGIKLLDYEHLIYPQNVAKLVEDLQQQIGEIDHDANVLVITREFNLPTLAITKFFDTKTTLYYLPIEPLHFLLQQSDRKPAAQLLLSVLCYFYQIGGIPYFGENSSYLYEVYQMINEWYSDKEICEYPKDYQHVIDHIQLIKRESGNLLKSLSDKDQLALLDDRVSKFYPTTKTEENLKAIAYRVSTLINIYPGRSIFDSIPDDLNRIDGEGRITAEHYLSFIWSGEDCLYDQLMETVNCELQEYNEIDEPMSIQLFDKPQNQISHNMSFEQEFFDLLNDLSDNLYDFAHEKHH